MPLLSMIPKKNGGIHHGIEWLLKSLQRNSTIEYGV
jgi:hypothetical protein